MATALLELFVDTTVLIVCWMVGITQCTGGRGFTWSETGPGRIFSTTLNTARSIATFAFSMTIRLTI